jgi:hypothetical protein
MMLTVLFGSDFEIFFFAVWKIICPHFIFSSNILALFLQLLYFREYVQFLMWDGNMRKDFLTFYLLWYWGLNSGLTP